MKNKYSMYKTNSPSRDETTQKTSNVAEKIRAKVISDVLLNVRNRANGDIIGSLKPNDMVEILEELGDWSKVSDGTLTGYSMSKYLKKVE